MLNPCSPANVDSVICICLISRRQLPNDLANETCDIHMVYSVLFLLATIGSLAYDSHSPSVSN
jgi:hypothetical protein